MTRRQALKIINRKDEREFKMGQAVWTFTHETPTLGDCKECRRTRYGESYLKPGKKQHITGIYYEEGRWGNHQRVYAYGNYASDTLDESGTDSGSKLYKTYKACVEYCEASNWLRQDGRKRTAIADRKHIEKSKAEATKK